MNLDVLFQKKQTIKLKHCDLKRICLWVILVPFCKSWISGLTEALVDMRSYIESNSFIPHEIGIVVWGFCLYSNTCCVYRKIAN